MRSAKLAVDSMLLEMKFSVIVPTWNAEKTIETCLDSIYGQSSVPDEVIVIDGGSTDATLSIVEKYLRPQDSVFSEPDESPYDAMNKGVAKAQGEIVAILNADDYWMLGTCESVRKAFAKCSQKTGIVHGDLRYMREDGTSHIIKPVPGVLNYFCLGMPTVHPATFINKKVYDDICQYDYENYPMCADRDFAYRALARGYRFDHIEQVLSCMCAGGVSARTPYYEEIELIMRRLPQPRKFFAKTLRWFLGYNEKYYHGYKNSWPKEIAIAIITMRGMPKKVLASITMRLAIRTRFRSAVGVIASKFK